MVGAGKTKARAAVKALLGDVVRMAATRTKVAVDEVEHMGKDRVDRDKVKARNDTAQIVAKMGTVLNCVSRKVPRARVTVERATRPCSKRTRRLNAASVNQPPVSLVLPILEVCIWSCAMGPATVRRYSLVCGMTRERVCRFRRKPAPTEVDGATELVVSGFVERVPHTVLIDPGSQVFALAPSSFFKNKELTLPAHCRSQWQMAVVLLVVHVVPWCPMRCLWNITAA